MVTCILCLTIFVFFVQEASSSAEAEAPNQLDGLLLNALANPRDRLTILKLDYELERFIKESRYGARTSARLSS